MDTLLSVLDSVACQFYGRKTVFDCSYECRKQQGDQTIDFEKKTIFITKFSLLESGRAYDCKYSTYRAIMQVHLWSYWQKYKL